MSNGVKIQEVVPENLRKQLSVAVRSIQWSYAIFWSLSTTQQGCDSFSLSPIVFLADYLFVSFTMDYFLIHI